MPVSSQLVHTESSIYNSTRVGIKDLIASVHSPQAGRKVTFLELHCRNYGENLVRPYDHILFKTKGPDNYHTDIRSMVTVSLAGPRTIQDW